MTMAPTPVPATGTGVLAAHGPSLQSVRARSFPRWCSHRISGLILAWHGRMPSMASGAPRKSENKTPPNPPRTCAASASRPTRGRLPACRHALAVAPRAAMPKASTQKAATREAAATPRPRFVHTSPTRPSSPCWAPRLTTSLLCSRAKAAKPSGPERRRVPKPAVTRPIDSTEQLSFPAPFPFPRFVCLISTARWAGQNTPAGCGMRRRFPARHTGAARVATQLR